MIEITEEEFKNSGSEGVWRSIGEVSGDFTFTDGGIITRTTFNSFRHVIAHAEKTVDGERFLDMCYVDGFKPHETEDVTCDNPVISYYKSADGTIHYSVIECDGGGITIHAFTMLSDIPEYDLGTATVTFDSDSYPDVTTDTGICGSLMEMDEQVEIVFSEDNTMIMDVLEFQITVRIPYEDNFLFLDFKFDELPVVGQAYELLPYDELEGSGQASLYVHSASALMGGTLDDIAVCHSEDGSLTLSHLDEISADGNFTATIEVGNDIFENISGTFSIAIE